MAPAANATGEGRVFKSSEGREAILATYRTLLGRWPVPYDTMTVPTRHGRTFVIRCGDTANPPLVLLHGSSANACMWMGDVAEYCKRYRVYAVDIPGEPGMSEAARCDLEGPAPVEWLDDLLDALKAGEPTLLGLSLGGWFAIKYASARPQRVERLVLLCPGGVSQPKLSFTLSAIPLVCLGEWGKRRAINMVNGNQDMPREAIEYSLLIANNFIPRRKIPVFSDEELRLITVPALLIVGLRDALFDSRKTVARLKRALPNLTERVLPDAGHALVNLSGLVMSILRGPDDTVV